MEKIPDIFGPWGLRLSRTSADSTRDLEQYHPQFWTHPHWEHTDVATEPGVWWQVLWYAEDRGGWKASDWCADAEGAVAEAVNDVTILCQKPRAHTKKWIRCA